MKHTIGLLLILTCCSNSFAQSFEKACQTPEGITNLLLEIISVEKGEAADWKTFKKLFLPKATIMFADPDKYQEPICLKVRQIKKNFNRGYIENGFTEKPLGYHVDQFNNLAQVFQAYESVYGNGENYERGVNAYQLVFRDNRWWISAITYSIETENTKIPKSFMIL